MAFPKTDVLFYLFWAGRIFILNIQMKYDIFVVVSKKKYYQQLEKKGEKTFFFHVKSTLETKSS